MSDHGLPEASPGSRRRRAAQSGHIGDEASARALLADKTPEVRATALRALARIGAVTEAQLTSALNDPAPVVRRGACHVASRLPTVAEPALTACLDDADSVVVEVAAWALGERGTGVERLCAVATSHADPLCREAAVAALGAIGDQRGLPAILTGTRDRVTVRRRAVIALAHFSGPEVDSALAQARDDKDWQVRQAAEDLS